MKDRHNDEFRSKVQVSPPTFGGRREGGHNYRMDHDARPPARRMMPSPSTAQGTSGRGVHSLSTKLFPCGSDDREGRKGGESTGVFEILMGAQSQS